MADETLLVEVRYDTDEAQVSVVDLTDDIFRLTEETKDLRKAQKGLKGDTDKNIKTRKEYNRQIEANKDAIKRARKERAQSIRTMKGEQTGLQKLGKSLKSTLTSYLGIAAAIGIAFKAIKGLININVEYEQSLASLQAITGATTQDLEFYSDAAKETSKVTLQSATDIVKAFELIGSARPELLKNKEALAEVTKQSIILSEATGGKLGLVDSAKSVTTVLNQMSLAGDQASRVINTLAAGSKIGAAPVTFLTTAFEKAGTQASIMGLSVEEVTGALEANAPFFAEASKLGNSFDKVLLKLKENQIGYTSGVFNLNDAIEELKGKYDTGTSAADIFGVEHAKLGELLVLNQGKFNEFTEAVTGTTIALEQQAIQNDTLGNNWKKLTNSIKNSFLSSGITDFLNGLLKRITLVSKRSKIAADTIGLAWDRLTGKISKEEYKESIEGLINAMANVKEITEATAESTAKADEDAKKRAIERQALAQAAAAEAKKKAAQDAKFRADAEEAERLEAETLLMKRETAAENRELDLEIEMEHREALAEIDAEFSEDKTEGLLTIASLERQLREQSLVAEEAAAEKKREIWRETIATIGQLSNEITATLISNNQSKANQELAILDAQKEAELKRAGDDANKKAKIEKDFEDRKLKVQKDASEKNKKIQIANAIIQGAIVVLNALGTTPFFPLGLLAAAGAAITTALQISTIKNQSFGKGGAVPLAKDGMQMGTFSGASHGGGGIDLFTGSGEHVANVEGKENFYVVNKNASDYINSLSDINQRVGGGVPLAKRGFKMQDGGQAEVPSQQGININEITKSVVDNLPPIIVRTEDIKTGLEQREKVTNVGVV